MSSAYTDLTSTFIYKMLLTWQRLSQLGNNDQYLKDRLDGLTLLGRRPLLQWNGVSTVDVEANTGTSNQTSIVFPDRAQLSVTENLASTQKYRRFDITKTAQFTSGTESGGLRSGLSEVANTWYAIYAVKSQINTANFVLVGDTTLPLAANFATLNSRYGTNSWVYLGMIRNGDNNLDTTDIIKFTQAGNHISFQVFTGTSGFAHKHLILATSGGSSGTIVPAAGTGNLNVPDHLTIADYYLASSSSLSGSGTMNVLAGGSASSSNLSVYFGRVTSGDAWAIPALSMATFDGLSYSIPSATGAILSLGGWYDPVLAGFANAI